MSDEVNQVPPVSVESRPGPQSETSKLLAGLGYLTGIVALIAILIEPYKDEEFVRLHAIQALALVVAAIAAQIILAVPVIGLIIGPLVSIGIVVLAILGAVKGFTGEYYEMPVVYDLVKQYV